MSFSPKKTMVEHNFQCTLMFVTADHFNLKPSLQSRTIYLDVFIQAFSTLGLIFLKLLLLVHKTYFILGHFYFRPTSTSSLFHLRRVSQQTFSSISHFYFRPYLPWAFSTLGLFCFRPLLLQAFSTLGLFHLRPFPQQDFLRCTSQLYLRSSTEAFLRSDPIFRETAGRV